MSKTKAAGSANRLKSAGGIRCGSWTSRKCRYARKGGLPGEDCRPMNSPAASASSKAEALFLLEVLVEPLVHPVLPARQAVGDEGRRGVTGVAEDLGHGQVDVLEDVVRVHVPVGEGVLAGEERGGGGLGVVGRSVAAREEGSPFRQAVDDRAGGLAISVAAETVGPQRVHEEDEDVRPRGLGGRTGGEGGQANRCGGGQEREETKDQGMRERSCGGGAIPPLRLSRPGVSRVIGFRFRVAGLAHAPGCNIKGVP